MLLPTSNVRFSKGIDPMPDRTFLDWPFFDQSHGSLTTRLETWTRDDLASLIEEEHQAGHEDAALDVVSRNMVQALGQGGWLKNCVSAEYGGAFEGRLDVRSLCLMREGLSYHSGLADFAFAMQGLGSGPISLFGSTEQKARYLPAVAQGEKIAAFAISETEAGSDPSAMTMTADKDGDGYVLNGSKTWISNAGLADYYVVFARTGEAPGAKGLSAFIVDADVEGLTISKRISVIAPHPLGTLSFSDCRIKASAMLGAPGEGFKIAMSTLDIFRSTVGAAALGFARRAFDEALQRVDQRLISGKPLSEYQMTQARLADMATAIDTSALLVYRAAWTKDWTGGRVSREAAMAKMHATESAQRVIDDAVQLFGGAGVVSGSVVERLYREIRALRIYEGTTEIQRLIISRGLLK